MSDIQNPQTTQSKQAKGKAPIHKVWDGAVSMAIFENFSAEGRPFYNVRIGRTYTDKVTGEARNTQSLRPNDLDKLFYLGTEAKRMIHMLNERNKEVDWSQNQQSQTPNSTQSHVGLENSAAPAQAQQSPQSQAQPATGLVAQRDTAMANRPAPQNSNKVATPDQQPVQES